MRHAWVLLIALLLPLAAPRISLGAAVAAEGVPNAVIEGNQADPTVTQPALTVVVTTGATVESLASTYHRDAAAIRWANQLVADTEPAPGSSLLLPPGPGALVQVLPGEDPSEFAQRLHLDTSVVLDYNQLATDTPLAAGTYLQVPLASAPSGSLNSEVFIPQAPGVPSVIPSSGPDDFPWGQCTWYVASRRAVTPWGGDAGQWLAAAAPYRPEGDVPIAGAIVVFDYWPLGHVGYVESVSSDGTFEISEMNYSGVPGGGFGRVDDRVIQPNDPSVVGFIY
jgi:surface antigen